MELQNSNKKYKSSNYLVYSCQYHVHLLLDVDPKIGIYSVITKIKGYTSKQLREEFPALKKRIPTLWTHSKFISSVGSVTLDVVKRYIEEQKHV